MAQAYISICHGLHKEFYRTKVKKPEVEKAFAYLRRYPDSESIREAFLTLLEASEERENLSQYMTKPMMTEAIQYANPGPVQTGKTDSSGSKVGRNAPCPCGSGKKYKKCCGGS